MPPVRRGRRRSASPYSKGLLSRCYRERRRGIAVEGDDDGGTSLSDDALGRVFAGLLDAAAVVRCAATCKRWARIVARDAAVHSCTLQTLPDLAVGFFHQENDGPTARTRRHTASAQPCFVPTAAGSRRFVIQQYSFISSLMVMDGGLRHDDTFFDYSRPVASRNGRLVLELRREAYSDGLRLCLCNPMTGEIMTMLPPLYGEDMPGRYYACALLTGDDLERPRSSSFFRLLLVYNRRSFTALRCYSSDVGCWRPEVRKAGDKITSQMLCRLGQAVVVRGVAYWPLNHAALGVRLSAGEVKDVCLVPYTRDFSSDNRLLGVSPEGGLSYIRGRPCGGILSVVVEDFRSVGGDTASRDEWVRRKVIRVPHLKVPSLDAIKMRWFCERSGLVMFTLGEGSSGKGTYALNLETEEVEKVVDGEGASWRNFCGYEMDRAAFLELLVR